jgi:hypothetical protein
MGVMFQTMNDSWRFPFRLGMTVGHSTNPRWQPGIGRGNNQPALSSRTTWWVESGQYAPFPTGFLCC